MDIAISHVENTLQLIISPGVMDLLYLSPKFSVPQVTLLFIFESGYWESK